VLAEAIIPLNGEAGHAIEMRRAFFSFSTIFSRQYLENHCSASGRSAQLVRQQRRSMCERFERAARENREHTLTPALAWVSAPTSPDSQPPGGLAVAVRRRILDRRSGERK